MDFVTTNDERRRRAARGAAGFTLIEAIIGMCVMMVVGLGAGSLFIYSINFNSGASDRARALALAQQRMEVLRVTAYDDLDMVANGFNGPVVVGSRTAGESDERTFSGVTTVTEDANLKLKTVTVTVTPVNSRRWTGGVALRTLRAATTTGTN